MLDVHKNELIYDEEPHIAVPPRTHTRGPAPTTLQADREPIRLDQYCAAIPADGWEIVTVRKTTSGWLKRKVNVATVRVWDGEASHARRRTVVISKTLDQKPKTKYSLSNGTLDDDTTQEYAYVQAQRYWVERCFDDAKHELGLSDYQVRKWQGWHHHHALVMMACLFIVKQRVAHDDAYPLMSVRDARLLIVAWLFGAEDDSRDLDGSNLKYSLSNLTLDGSRMSWCELLLRHMQRYWVERSFEDAKSEVGMDEYQVRTWRAWHHHMALTMLALLFLLIQRIIHQEEVPRSYHVAIFAGFWLKHFPKRPTLYKMSSN